MRRWSPGILLLGLVAAGAPARAQDGAARAADEAPASSEGLERLIDALRTSDSFKVRATAAVALGRTGDARAIPALAEALLRNDEHFAVRAAAAGALGRAQDRAAIEPLLAGVHDDDEYVQREADEALQRYHTTAFLYAFRDALRDDDAVTRRYAVRAYADVARQPDASPGVALLLMQALGDDDDAVVKAAQDGIAELPHERAVPMLVDGLSSGDSGVRAASARLLEKRADPRAVDGLIALVVDTSQTEDVRAAARAALKKHLEYLHVDALLAASADVGADHQAARIQALRVLAAVGDARSFALIDKALADADANVRIAAARAAVDLGDAKVRPLLEAAQAREVDPRHKRQLELILKSLH